MAVARCIISSTLTKRGPTCRRVGFKHQRTARLASYRIPAAFAWLHGQVVASTCGYGTARTGCLDGPYSWIYRIHSAALCNPNEGLEASTKHRRTLGQDQMSIKARIRGDLPWPGYILHLAHEMVQPKCDFLARELPFLRLLPFHVELSLAGPESNTYNTKGRFRFAQPGPTVP